MAMQMTEKQIKLAAKVGHDCFEASVQLQEIIPLQTPAEQKKLPTPWDEHFNRKDITKENWAELDAICTTAYEEDYNEYMAYEASISPEERARQIKEADDEFNNMINMFLEMD